MTDATMTRLAQAALATSLRGCRLFAGLPPADLADIASITQLRGLTPGEYLFREGDPARGFYIVRRGAVNVHRVSAAGKEQVIRVFRAGESFAEATLATEAGYPADARAVEPAQVLLVRKAEFLRLLGRRPELALRMLAAMSLHLRALVGQLEDLTLKDVETRLAHWLLQRCPADTEGPVTVQVPGTKRMLAAELGTVSETLSRTLGKFRDQQWITVKGRAIVVRSPDGLRALARRNTCR